MDRNFTGLKSGNAYSYNSALRGSSIGGQRSSTGFQGRSQSASPARSGMSVMQREVEEESGSPIMNLNDVIDMVRGEIENILRKNETADTIGKEKNLLPVYTARSKECEMHATDIKSMTLQAFISSQEKKVESALDSIADKKLNGGIVAMIWHRHLTEEVLLLAMDHVRDEVMERKTRLIDELGRYEVDEKLAKMAVKLSAADADKKKEVIYFDVLGPGIEEIEKLNAGYVEKMRKYEESRRETGPKKGSLCVVRDENDEDAHDGKQVTVIKDPKRGEWTVRFTDAEDENNDFRVSKDFLQVVEEDDSETDEKPQKPEWKCIEWKQCVSDTLGTRALESMGRNQALTDAGIFGVFSERKGYWRDDDETELVINGEINKTFTGLLAKLVRAVESCTSETIDPRKDTLRQIEELDGYLAAMGVFQNKFSFQKQLLEQLGTAIRKNCAQRAREVKGDANLTVALEEQTTFCLRREDRNDVLLHMNPQGERWQVGAMLRNIKSRFGKSDLSLFLKIVVPALQGRTAQSCSLVDLAGNVTNQYQSLKMMGSLKYMSAFYLPFMLLLSSLERREYSQVRVEILKDIQSSKTEEEMAKCDADNTDPTLCPTFIRLTDIMKAYAEADTFTMKDLGGAPSRFRGNGNGYNGGQSGQGGEARSAAAAGRADDEFEAVRKRYPTQAGTALVARSDMASPVDLGRTQGPYIAAVSNCLDCKAVVMWRKENHKDQKEKGPGNCVSKGKNKDSRLPDQLCPGLICARCKLFGHSVGNCRVKDSDLIAVGLVKKAGSTGGMAAARKEAEAGDA